MLCSACSKLLIKHTQKKCMRCNGEVLNNISCLCDHCSNDSKQCSACLKKVQQQPIKNKGGCGSCGGKK